jgi:hypothetical protein
VHFLDWVLEQQTEPGVAGVFGQLIYQDINNGCGARFTTPMEWQYHFTLKHKKNVHALTSLLEDAYVAYLDRFNEAN